MFTNSFLFLLGMLQIKGTISFDEVCSLFFCNKKHIEWIKIYLERRNIYDYITKDEGISITFKYTNFNVLEKHMLLWIHNTSDIFHPILYNLEEEQFYSLLLGWTFIAPKFIDSFNKEFYHVFYNKKQTISNICNLLIKFNIKYYLSESNELYLISTQESSSDDEE